MTTGPRLSVVSSWKAGDWGSDASEDILIESDAVLVRKPDRNRKGSGVRCIKISYFLKSRLSTDMALQYEDRVSIVV